MFEMIKKYHKDQKYGNFPYLKHLNDVYIIVKKYFPDDINMKRAALLHDIIEDTECTYSDVFDKFGKDTADLVYSVTDESGKTRAERKRKTYKKLILNERAVYIKVADRIANVSFSKKTNNTRMYNMYKKENTLFMKLKTTDHDIWKEYLNII